MTIVVGFQSRFGRAKWLEPATDETLMKLAREGTKKVAIFAPGFSVDCLETLEELAMQGHEQFEEAGGTHYAYLPCLNDSDIGMDMLEQIIGQELAGWTLVPLGINHGEIGNQESNACHELRWLQAGPEVLAKQSV
ncbi:MAG: hypothetical protein RLZZ604_1364 [Pseudomonadota bacterium]